jgi:hypothetical protein
VGFAAVTEVEANLAAGLSRRLRVFRRLGVGGMGAVLCRAERRSAKGVRRDDEFWGKLGLMLYDGRYYPEALAVMTRVAGVAGSDSDWRFAALVWQGHLLDLLGRRSVAASYPWPLPAF